jgi:hypothetical protein
VGWEPFRCGMRWRAPAWCVCMSRCWEAVCLPAAVCVWMCVLCVLVRPISVLGQAADGPLLSVAERAAVLSQLDALLAVCARVVEGRHVTEVVHKVLSLLTEVMATLLALENHEAHRYVAKALINLQATERLANAQFGDAVDSGFVVALVRSLRERLVGKSADLEAQSLLADGAKIRKEQAKRGRLGALSQVKDMRDVFKEMIEGAIGAPRSGAQGHGGRSGGPSGHGQKAPRYHADLTPSEGRALGALIKASTAAQGQCAVCHALGRDAESRGHMARQCSSERVREALKRMRPTV